MSAGRTAAAVRVNGETVPVGHGTTLAGLLLGRGIPAEARGVAVARNGTVVRRTVWSETVLADGDVVEIVRAFQGG